MATDHRPAGEDSAMEGEDRLVAWLRRRLGEGEGRTSGAAVDLLGDDAAHLTPAAPTPDGTRLVVTVDSQVAGVHFPRDLEESLLAHRLLEVNLSDLAAAGARPRWAFLALTTGAEFDHRTFFDAFLAACADRGVTLAGGDLARTDHTVATLTLLGEGPPAPAAAGRHPPLHRGNGRPGDRLWVAGTLGESGAGCRLVARGARLHGDTVTLPDGFEGSVAEAARRAVRRHLQPRAQLELGRALARLPRVAAMDLSDGLARDLPRLCRESGVAAVVQAEALPRPEGFADLVAALVRTGDGETGGDATGAAGNDEGDPTLSWMLEGGEDYVLLFTLPPGEEPPGGFPATAVGRLEAGEGVVLEHHGHRSPMPAVGWDHLAGDR